MLHSVVAHPSCCPHSQASVGLCTLQGGADVADRPRGWSLLHLAAALGQEASVSFLLAKKLPVNGEHHQFLACIPGAVDRSLFTRLAC